jgi:hypothetical protein
MCLYVSAREREKKCVYEVLSERVCALGDKRRKERECDSARKRVCVCVCVCVCVSVSE